MLLLLMDDLTQSLGRWRVDLIERRKLIVQMAQDDPFDRHGRGGDRAPSQQARDRTERKPANRAKMVAAAAAQSASIEHGLESGAMAQFMIAEMAQFIRQVGGSPSSDPYLGGVNADRAMLSGVVDLHHPVAERFTSLEARSDCHRLLVASRPNIRNGSEAGGDAERKALAERDRPVPLCSWRVGHSPLWQAHFFHSSLILTLASFDG